MTAEEKLTMAVTPQVLEDYHNTKVAPFLNPAIQCFGKSDVYSTSETWVGQWTDKKPLYQKTINCGALVNSGKKEVSVSDLNIDNCILLTGVAKASDTHTIYLPHIETSDYVRADFYQNKIRIFGSGTWTFYTCYITLLYTKTTDSAISVPLGDPNEYTADERWVGMWMGQPLYQKTVNCGALPNNTRKEVSHGISNISNIPFVIGHWNYQNSTFGIMPWVSNSSLNEGIQLQASKSKILIDTKIDYSDAIGYVTLRYTKTS